VLIKDWLAELEIEGKTIEEGTLEHSWDDEPAADPSVAATTDHTPSNGVHTDAHGEADRVGS